MLLDVTNFIKALCIYIMHQQMKLLITQILNKKAMNYILLQCLLSFATLCYSLPLSTSSRWIIDEPTGARVKLACVNWAAHLEPMLAEGLDKKPLPDIARHVAQMGFTCVRLTWATHTFTRYANLTVAQSFRNLGLQDSFNGIAQYNPGILNLSVVNAQRAVVDELVHQGVMVVLDNHVSQPSWCCGDNDGNGFFGDKYFDPIEWLQGLAIVAKLYKNTLMVVGMSLRNELRGPLQNTSEWYRNIARGARTINEANPRLLVIVSGMHYDLSFAFLKENPLKLNFKHKLVYEIHRYAFTAGQRELLLNQPFTRACENITQEIHRQAGFLVEGENVAPLIASEFGIKQVDVDRADSLFLGCFLGYLAEMDLDWGVWALQGSYYIRHGVHGLDETYGMLNSNWSSVRNPGFQQKLQLIQQQTQGPNLMGPTYRILHHPSSGRCIRVDNKSEVHASDCWGYSKWIYNGKGNPIRLDGTELCLTAVGDGIPVTLTPDCRNNRSKWELISSSNFQVANKDEHGKYLCLDWDPNYSSRVLTKSCTCLEENDILNCQESSHDSQWFKIISANAQ